MRWNNQLRCLVSVIRKRVDRNSIGNGNLRSFHSGESWALKRPLENVPRPLHHYFQQMGISTSRVLSDSSSDAKPISSPLIPISAARAAQSESQAENQPVKPKRDKVQAVLKGIKQSPKKVNLVATLVRGMRVEDALMQLQLTVKRASKTVHKVLHSARANAVHNHGLDADCLMVAEAFVGKGRFQKRPYYHAKMRQGIIMKPECRLTVIVRESTPAEEAQIAKIKVNNFKKLSKRERQLVPHKLIESTPIWGRKNKANNDASRVRA